MTSVHEHMHQRAGEHDQKRQEAQRVLAVPRQQVCDTGKRECREAGRQKPPDAPERLASRARLVGPAHRSAGGSLHRPEACSWPSVQSGGSLAGNDSRPASSTAAPAARREQQHPVSPARRDDGCDPAVIAGLAHSQHLAAAIVRDAHRVHAHASRFGMVVGVRNAHLALHLLAVRHLLGLRFRSGAARREGQRGVRRGGGPEEMRVQVSIGASAQQQ